MPRKITKNQFAELWISEFASKDGFCILCGQIGIIDTSSKIKTPAGKECGGKAYCICPNGRALKKAVSVCN